jgi:hypothetical protein
LKRINLKIFAQFIGKASFFAQYFRNGRTPGRRILLASWIVTCQRAYFISARFSDGTLFVPMLSILSIQNGKTTVARQERRLTVALPRVRFNGAIADGYNDSSSVVF